MNLQITGTLMHAQFTASGTITIGDSETESSINFTHTDMYRLDTADGRKYLFPVIGTVLQEHDL